MGRLRAVHGARPGHSRGGQNEQGGRQQPHGDERQRATDEDAADAVKVAHDGQAADVPRNDGDEHPGGDLHGDEDDKEGDDARLGHGVAGEEVPETSAQRGVEVKGQEEGAEKGGQGEQRPTSPRRKPR